MDRRNFVISTAAAAQTVLAQAVNDKVGTAMIGVGNRGSYLLKAVLSQPDARVVALCDNKPDRLDKAATAADWHVMARALLLKSRLVIAARQNSANWRASLKPNFCLMEHCALVGLHRLLSPRQLR